MLTIAGFDPSSGAGMTADLAVFAAHGCFGTACITALTVQSTTGVRSVVPTDGRVLRETLACLQEDLPPAGIKIGMLGELAAVEAVVDYLRRVRAQERCPIVVLDPVLRSTSGRPLIAPDALELLREEMLTLVDWVTPNIEELGELTDRKLLTKNEIEDAARSLQQARKELGILVTGGELDPPDDLLVPPHDGASVWMRGAARLQTTSTHGTGCALSSALLSCLVLGKDPVDAAASAKRYVYRAIETAPGLGQGNGPLNHLWPLRLVDTSD